MVLNYTQKNKKYCGFAVKDMNEQPQILLNKKAWANRSVLHNVKTESHFSMF